MIPKSGDEQEVRIVPTRAGLLSHVEICRKCEANFVYVRKKENLALEILDTGEDGIYD
jgi:hypothetical protein